MKNDLANYTFAVGLAPVSVAAGTDAGATVDQTLGPCAAFILNVGSVASGASITMKGQYSTDDSTWSDDDGTTGNDYTTAMTGSGIATLNVPNPMARYVRAFITVATDAVVNGIINVVGPLRHIDAE